MTQEFAEHRDRAEALISQGKQLLRQAALDFGMQFARSLRQDIETLMQELQASLAQADAAQIKHRYDNLEIKLDELVDTCSRLAQDSEGEWGQN